MIPAAAGRKGEPDLNDIAVQFRHVSMAFPGVLANDDVSLDIRKGEVFALVGENGAGKSTLMNILYGIHTPTGGSVSIRSAASARATPSTTASAWCTSTSCSCRRLPWRRTSS